MVERRVQVHELWCYGFYLAGRKFAVIPLGYHLEGLA